MNAAAAADADANEEGNEYSRRTAHDNNAFFNANRNLPPYVVEVKYVTPYTV